jgi:hypothetical protein
VREGERCRVGNTLCSLAALRAKAARERRLLLAGGLSDRSIKIGEISRELETAKHGPGRGNKSLPSDGKPFKAETLAAAGISTSAAQAL